MVDAFSGTNRVNVRSIRSSVLTESTFTVDAFSGTNGE